ncbi:protein phosphatase 2C domain-containing protein [Nonomuraea purpurea]|uniref:Protein phosphatase 2C domain-containing protein n=1 Tax=Nonomuraea purpurea TaxID=1849276 RepID=A0ABV8G845_9ACTN
MRIDIVARPASQEDPNEDYAAVVLADGGVAVVLDGVTPPADGDTGCAHDVPWFTARLGGALVELAGSRREWDLAACLSEAITRTAAAHGPGCDLSHKRTPQATAALLRWDEERVEHLVLSDAAILLGGKDGTITPVLDTRLTVLRLRPDLRALRERVKALAPGTAESEAAVHAYVGAVTALRNAEGGFFTVAADPDVAGRAVTGLTPRADVTDAAALTDGATRWTEVFGLGDFPALLSLVREEGLNTLLAQVRASEHADPEGEEFPRGKRHDDVAGVYVEL